LLLRNSRKREMDQYLNSPKILCGITQHHE
jgi:hypothetical protein